MTVYADAANRLRRSVADPPEFLGNLVTMNPSNKHHFIPAFYLQKWAGVGGKGDELIEWSKPYRTVQPMRRHPNATGFELALYTFPDLVDPASRQLFESEFLRHVDTRASEVIDLIIAGQGFTLNDRQKSDWVRFLMSLHFRHPDVVAEIREGNAFVWRNHDRFTKATYESVREANDPATFDEYLARLQPDGGKRVELDLLVAAMDNEIIGKRIVSMAWGIYDTSNARHRLLTSDWPIELALGTPMVMLPLSPTCLFIATDDPVELHSIGAGDLDRIVDYMNAYVVGHARRYVFSEDERQRTFIQNRMSTSVVERPFFPILKAALAG